MLALKPNIALLSRSIEKYDVSRTLDTVENYQGYKAELYTMVLILM